MSNKQQMTFEECWYKVQILERYRESAERQIEILKTMVAELKAGREQQLMLHKSECAGLEGQIARQDKVCAEILRIMKTYHEQEAAGYVDTPGGLEHMGDVWRLLGKWERMLSDSSNAKEG